MKSGNKQAPPNLVGPLYTQVAAILRRRILDREWPIGRPIPNEEMLAEEIGVSIGTMRKALDALTHEKLIVRRQGRGTFVADVTDDTELDRFSNLYSDGRKLKAGASSVERSVGQATPDEAAKLGLAPGQSVVRLHRLRRTSDRIKGIETLIVPAETFPGLDQVDDLSAPILFPIYRRHYNIVIAAAVESVSALNANEVISEALKIPLNQAILSIERVAVEINGGPVEWSKRYINMAGSEYIVHMQERRWRRLRTCPHPVQYLRLGAWKPLVKRSPNLSPRRPATVHSTSLPSAQE
jgi:GntR family transcriptional regulator